MREYETLCVFKGRTTEKELEDINTRLLKIIKDQKGELLAKRLLGKRSLSYRIEKEKEGIFLCFNYSGEGSLVSEFEKVLRYDERVLRFMTTKMSEHVDIEKRKEELKSVEAN